MLNYDELINYVELKDKLMVDVANENYEGVYIISAQLKSIKEYIDNLNLDVVINNCQKIIDIANSLKAKNSGETASNVLHLADNFPATIKQIRTNKLAAKTDSTKPADNVIYYHLIIEGNSYRFGAGRIGSTFNNSVYCSADEEDFIDSCCQILLNKGIIANIVEELNAVVGGAKKFIEYTKQANSSRVESSSRYRVADKGMK